MSWEWLWGGVLIATLVAFAVLAVLATVGGALDCLKLFRRLDDDEPN